MGLLYAADLGLQANYTRSSVRHLALLAQNFFPQNRFNHWDLRGCDVDHTRK